MVYFLTIIWQKIDMKFEYNFKADSAWLRGCKNNAVLVGVGVVKVYLKEEGSAYRSAEGNKDP